MNVVKASEFQISNQDYNFYFGNVMKRCFHLTELPVNDNCYLIRSNMETVTLKDIVKNKIDIIKVL